MDEITVTPTSFDALGELLDARRNDPDARVVLRHTSFRLWWKAEINGKLVGCAGGLMQEPGALLLGLYVRPDARRQGVARALLNARLAWAKAQGLSWVYAFAVPDRAESLRRLGWTSGGRNDKGVEFFVRLLA